MNDTPKRKITVEVINTPRPGDALAHAASVLTSATHVRQVDADRRVKEAQRALAPVVEDAKKILGDVDELYKKHGDQLHKLSAINWPALQARGISPDHTNRVNRLVSELLNTFGGVRATLGDIARRVDGIVAESRRALDRGSFGVAERALARAEKARSVRTRPERSWAAARNG